MTLLGEGFVRLDDLERTQLCLVDNVNAVLPNFVQFDESIEDKKVKLYLEFVGEER